MTRVRRAAAVTGMMIALAAPARAQAPDPPRVSVTFGAGVANPLHGDLSYVAPLWRASVRLAPSRHLLLDVSYGEWRHTTTRETPNVVFRDAAGTVIGLADRIIDRSEETRPEFAINLLGAWSAGRATFFAGGGPGVMLFRRHFTQTFDGCRSQSLSCASYENRFRSGSFSAQVAAGLDVTIASRVGAFGEFRMSMPIEDIGSSQTAVTGGVRVALWQ